jgi:hypothetical protein
MTPSFAADLLSRDAERLKHTLNERPQKTIIRSAIIPCDGPASEFPKIYSYAVKHLRTYLNQYAGAVVEHVRPIFVDDGCIDQHMRIEMQISHSGELPKPKSGIMHCSMSIEHNDQWKEKKYLLLT